MVRLKIEYVPKEDLKPYANNAKLHPVEQVEQIEESIRRYDFNDPIAVWGENEVVEGHGRLLAAMEMDDITELPIIRLDHLSEEKRREYALVHNKLTMNTDFDYDILSEELGAIIDFDMSDFGFIINDFDPVDFFGDAETENPGTRSGMETEKTGKTKVQCPHCGEWFEI